MQMRITAVLVLLLAAAACEGGATTPDPVLSVELTATTEYVRQIPHADGSFDVACGVRFRVVGSGAAAQATWTGGVIRYYAGADRTTPVDSFPPLTADQVTGMLGGTLIHPGYDETSAWQLAQRQPFTVQAELRYRVAGRGQQEQSATAWTECRP